MYDMCPRQVKHPFGLLWLGPTTTDNRYRRQQHNRYIKTHFSWKCTCTEAEARRGVVPAVNVVRGERGPEPIIVVGCDDGGLDWLSWGYRTYVSCECRVSRSTMGLYNPTNTTHERAPPRPAVARLRRGREEPPQPAELQARGVVQEGARREAHARAYEFVFCGGMFVVDVSPPRCGAVRFLYTYA